MAGSVPGARAAYRMPWRPGPAWLFSARDVAAMRAFRHECGTVHAVLTGLMEPRPTVGLGSSFRPRSDSIKLLGHLHHSVHTRPSGSRSCECIVSDGFVPVHVADLRVYITPVFKFI